MAILPPQNQKLEWQRALVTLSLVVTTTVIVGALYWAQVVFIPLAMAVFLAFVLNPLVKFLQRRRLGRSVSVIAVVVGALIAFVGISAIVTQQLTALSATMAERSGNIKVRIDSVKAQFAGSGDSSTAKMFADFEEALTGKKPNPDADAVAAPPPTTIIMAPARSPWSSRLQVIVGPATEAFGMAAFSFILVVFILLAQSDLQDRILRLMGDGQMTTATQAAEETSQRISSYLFTQLLINTGFGVLITACLFFAEVQYSLLWGFIATLMRYVPYIGTWIGLLPPTLFSLVVTDGWTQPILIVALFLGLEAICNNLLEPRLYGKSLGISEVALLVMAAFWSFLWGPIGLILSGPITTCMLVVAKHSPRVHFLYVLLGTESPLSPGMMLYQRFVSGNVDGATEVLETGFKSEQPLQTMDEALIPALSAIREARAAEQLDEAGDTRVMKTVREALENVLEEHPLLSVAVVDSRARVLVCPAYDELDTLSAQVLSRQLPTEKWDLRFLQATSLVSEMAEAVASFAPHAILISSLPPGGVAHTRYLCKRLRGRFPEVKILVGRWNDETPNIVEEFVAVGASTVDTTLAKAYEELNGWLPVFAAGNEAPTTVKPGAKSTSKQSVGTASAT